MSQYHSNPEEVPSIGRVLRSPDGLKTSITTLQQLLRPGEILIGYYDAHWRKIALVLKQQDDIDTFYQYYASGHFVAMEYYALPQEKLHVRLP
jgi:hypothetical protein